MLKIKVHRGSHQIGGSITEIYTEKTHIFVDFGSELNADPEDSTDSEMIDMMQHAQCDAVLFTHYHGDHVGLMKYIPHTDVNGNMIKLGFGKLAREVLINIHKTLVDFPDADKEEHTAYLNLLRDEERKIDIVEGEVITIGDIMITPVSVDHSAMDAYMFIIESGGSTIVHTGDFRTHGRLGYDLFERVEKALSGKTVDALLIEGTMMSRLNDKVLTEEEMQAEALKILKKPENKYAFLICSSTNAESLASFANAAMYLGRAFYVNSYVYEQIELYRKYAGGEGSPFNFWKTYPFENMEAYNPKLKMTQPEFMRKNGFLMMIGSSDSYRKRIDYFKDDNPLLIYSMWKGYVDEGEDTYDENWGKLYHGWDPKRRKDLHTSGHATAGDIRRMILTVKPQKYILPIHTEEPDQFTLLDIGEYADMIDRKLRDGKIVEL